MSFVRGYLYGLAFNIPVWAVIVLTIWIAT